MWERSKDGGGLQEEMILCDFPVKIFGSKSIFLPSFDLIYVPVLSTLSFFYGIEHLKRFEDSVEGAIFYQISMQT